MWRYFFNEISVSANKSKGRQTSKIVKSRQSYSNGHLSYHCLIYYLVRALMHDSTCEFNCVCSKDAQKLLARTSLESRRNDQQVRYPR